VSKSTKRPIILRIQSQRKLREIKLRKLSVETKNCRNKKANYLSIHRGLEREGDCSWEEKTKIFDIGRTECTATWC